MKRFISIMLFTAAIGLPLAAQDTVPSDGIPEAYYHGLWVEGDTIISGRLGIDANYIVEEAVAYHTTDSLTIYGLAISLNLDDMASSSMPYFYQDTTLDSIYCYVRLYSPIGDSLEVVAERRIHMRDTPVSYYLALNKWDLRHPSQLLKPFPVYECFLDTPVVVTDTFYVGFAYDKCKPHYDISTYSYVYPYRYDILCYAFSGMNMRFQDSYTRASRLAPDFIPRPPIQAPGSWKFHTSNYVDFFLFMYAITAPQDSITDIEDTTVTPIDTVTPGGDTLGVQTADLVSRYVSVLPNPAHERAEVLSSFGLTKIELYDEQGRRLRSLPASGLKATLDLHSLPPSTYLLRIHTPAGTATKKLLVQ